MVPVFRIISEPLRIYLLYKTLFAALKGQQHGWNKLPRTGTVTVDAALTDRRVNAPTIWAPPHPAATEGAAVLAPSFTPTRPYPRLAPIPWTHEPVGVAID